MDDKKQIQVENDDRECDSKDNNHRTLLASDGAGPLLQRDYCAVIENSRYTPEQIVEHMLSNFPQFSPEELAAFSCNTGSATPLTTGDEMEIKIKMTGLCHVRVVHMDERSLTMRTLDGHPEAGRITLGAFCDDNGDLVFRIRSRARASSSVKYIGYELFGKSMQTKVWVTFIERVAQACGGTIRGEIQITEEEVSGTLADTGEVDTPTFLTSDRS